MFKFILLLLTACLTHAATWSQTNVQYLYGSNFNQLVGGNSIENGVMKTITLEHASGWGYGKNFFFVDMTSAQFTSGKQHQVYAEFTPKLSLSKTTTLPLEFAFIKDIYLAFELNQGDNFQATNYGVAFELQVPSFNFFDVNFYSRDDNFNKPTYQITLAWKSSFEVLTLPLIFEGFLDYYGTDTSVITLAQPRLLLEGKRFTQTLDTLHLGVELYYYHDKIAQTQEAVPQAMVKWIF